MRFTKIKLTKGETVLEWETDEGAEQLDSHEHKFRSSAAPHPDFVQAMAAFSVPALRLLELPLAYEDNLTVSGLSFTYEEQRGRGLVVTLQKKLGGAPSPLIFNTPYLPEDGGEHNPSLPAAFAHAIDDVIAEAREFLNGKRAQGDLFAGDQRVSDTKLTTKERDAAARAIERLRPKKGEGAVELTMDGQGVRLTHDTTEIIGR